MPTSSGVDWCFGEDDVYLLVEKALDTAVNEALDQQVPGECRLPDLLVRIATELVKVSRKYQDGSTADGYATFVLPPGNEWTVTGFIASIPGIASTIASALVEEADPNPFAALQRFGNMPNARDAVRARIAACVDSLTQLIQPKLEELVQHEATIADPNTAELQEKFSLDTHTYEGEYGTLSTFFGGLQEIIGSPEPKAMDAMCNEHTRGVDSKVEFTTGNYDVTTTAEVEWEFVATPESPRQFPSEKKIAAAQHLKSNKQLARTKSLQAIIDSRAKPRSPIPLAQLQEKAKGVNKRLDDLNLQGVKDEEVVGARLYTGPMFCKYNAVLRGRQSATQYPKKQMIELCCAQHDADDYANGTLECDEACKRANMYATTIHAINSCIVKLSKITEAKPVYRGVSGMKLPEAFLKTNEFGVRGGIETAFMSATRDYKVAKQYAARSSTQTIFNIQQGMVSRGADLEWLSQYPHEEVHHQHIAQHICVRWMGTSEGMFPPCRKLSSRHLLG